VCGSAALGVPELVARIPEPAPKAEEPGPAPRYGPVAALPGLRYRAALVAAVCGALLGGAVGLDWMLLFLLPLAFLLFSGREKRPTQRITRLDWAWAAASLVTCAWVFVNAHELTERWEGVHPVTLTQVVIGTVLVAAVLEASRRSVGFWFFVTTLGFMAYLVLAPWLPGFLRSPRAYSYPRLIEMFFLYADEDQSRTSLTAAGFVAVAVTTIAQTWTVRDADDVFTAILNGTVRAAAVLKRQPPDVLARIRQAVRAEIETYVDGERYRIPMPAVLTTATKPPACPAGEG